MLLFLFLFLFFLVPVLVFSVSGVGGVTHVVVDDNGFMMAVDHVIAAVVQSVLRK